MKYSQAAKQQVAYPHIQMALKHIQANLVKGITQRQLLVDIFHVMQEDLTVL